MKKRSKTNKCPVPTVDIIIEYRGGIVLIKRKNEPLGWAIPGGFVDYGESLETAAQREAKEETSLDVALIRQFHTYSDPGRDKRMHTITTVYVARASAEAEAQADDDAADYGVFSQSSLPSPIVFDHKRILEDYFNQVY
jgi:ADP-ribose pyrophosphatase YjhB (NUDIX family)